MNTTGKKISRGTLAIVACVLVVLGFYVRSSWSYGKSLNPVPQANDFHNLVADSILAGQASLILDAPKGLLALDDPFDPRANADYRVGGLHDLSLYDGELHSYFGPAPAVLAFIPFQLFNVGDLSPTLATLLFCCVGFLASYLLFRLLVRYCCGGVSAWQHCLAVLALGLGTPVAWIVYIGRAYETSEACGYALLFVGMYLLARGALVGSEVWSVALGSAALALAVAARPNLLVAGLYIALVALQISRGATDSNRNAFLVALIVPYATIGALIGAYNVMRFDSLFEFGQSYQLAGTNIPKYPYGRVSYVPKGIYYYLFSPARVHRSYPYLHLRASDVLTAKPTKYANTPVAGAITNMPANFVGLFLAGVAVPRLAESTRRALLALTALLTPALILLVLTSYYFKGTNFRYELDFVPLITLASVLGWAVWSRAPHRSTWTGRIGHASWAIALAGSVAFNLAITFTPCAGTGAC